MLTMLKTLRKEKGITQHQLSEALHISQTSISKYERGISEPDLSLLLAMADYFEVSVDLFLRGTQSVSNRAFSSGRKEAGESSEK